MQQDSTDPTGIAIPEGKKVPDSAIRARQRKANAALALKLSGATWEEVAEASGFPTARAAVIAVERALERQLKNDTSKEKMRTLAGQRLERLLRSCWVKAIDPENPEHLVALTKAREIIDRHAKLYGLDAPTEVVVHSPTADELQRWVAQVTAATLPQVTEYDIFEGEVISDTDDDEGGSTALVKVG